MAGGIGVDVSGAANEVVIRGNTKFQGWEGPRAAGPSTCTYE